MTEYDIVSKIHEIRSYIASDWPRVEDRKRLYEALKTLEASLKEIRNAAEKAKPEKDKEA